MRLRGRAPLVQASPTWRAALTLALYRSVIAFGLVAAMSTGHASALFMPAFAALFRSTCLAYLAIGVALTSTALIRWPRLSVHVVIQILVDIGALILLSYAGSGAAGGLAMLLLVPLAAAGMLLSARRAILLAALAVLGLLGQETLRYWQVVDAPINFIQSGILGLLYFATAGLAHELARRIRTSDASAASHASQARDLAELNRHIIDRMQIGAVVLDAAGRVQTLNRAARALLGAGAREADTPTSLRRLSPPLADALAAWRRGTRTPETIDTPDATLLVSLARLGENDDPGVLIFIEDTRRASAQAQHMKLAALGRLTAGIAHEIRNPLGAISHAGQLLSESTALERDDAHLLDMIHRHSQRIDRIVDDVLGLARRSAQQPRVFALDEWLSGVIADYTQSRPDPPRMSIDRDTPDARVRFDPGHLRQVLFNLWDNSDRHARHAEGRAPTIRMTLRRETAEQLLLECTDDGPGIDDDAIDRILEPFFTTAHDGTGLGLHIARELCEANGARLNPVARASGACFRIWLPRGPYEPEPVST